MTYQPPADFDAPLEPPPPEEGGMISVALPEGSAIVTKVLVGIILAVFALGALLAATTGVDWLSVLGAKDNTAILVDHQYYRLVTVMFLHGGFLHVAMNTYALWIIGQDVERFYGHARFLAVFFLGGLSASAFSLAFTPGRAVGASGAVFAIFAAEMVLLYRNRELFGAGARQRLQSLVMLLLLNAAIGLVGAGVIDNWAHIGGFLGGAVFSWLLVPDYRVALPLDGLGPARLEDVGGGPGLWVVVAGGLAALAAAVAWLTLRAG